MCLKKKLRTLGKKDFFKCYRTQNDFSGYIKRTITWIYLFQCKQMDVIMGEWERDWP